MTVEIVFGSIAAAGAIISSIFGGGLFNRYVKNSNDLAVAKYILDKQQTQIDSVITDVRKLQTNSAQVNAKLDQFERYIEKLDQIPTLVAKMDAMEKVVANVQSLVMTIAEDQEV